ncbi:MAG: hypothetical protein ACKV2V_00130 [Blastocatellia bacterium]
MNRMLLLIAMMFLLVPATMAGMDHSEIPDNAVDTASRVQRLEEELRSLRAEVIRLQITALKNLIAQLENELQTIRAEKQKAENHEAARIAQLEGVNETLSRGVVDADTRAEAESMKTALSGPAVIQQAERKQAIEQREIEASEQLGRAQRQLQALAKTVQALGVK